MSEVGYRSASACIITGWRSHLVADAHRVDEVQVLVVGERRPPGCPRWSGCAYRQSDRRWAAPPDTFGYNRLRFAGKNGCDVGTLVAGEGCRGRLVVAAEMVSSRMTPSTARPARISHGVFDPGPGGRWSWIGPPPANERILLNWVGRRIGPPCGLASQYGSCHTYSGVGRL